MDKPTTEKETPPAFVFDGFEPANTTPVPDVLFDELLTELSGTELKVLLYIIRRTLGFKKSSDGISLTQFTDGITTKDGRVLDKGCGIKKRSTVSKVLRDLIGKGCVESEKGKTDMGDDAVTIYRVRFKGVVAKSALPSAQTATTVVPKQPLPGSAQTATRGSADLATHKKQYARNSVQETDKQEGTYSAGEQNSTPQSVADATTPALQSSQPINFVEAREYLTSLGYKLEPTPQAYECEEPGKALWSVSEPNAHHLFDTLTTTKIKQLATRLKERAHQPEKPASEKSEQDSVATPELSTLTGTSPQTSAKVGPVDIHTLTIAAHVNYAFKWLDAVRQKAEKNPQASYVQNKTASGLIRNLIESTMNTPNELTEQNIYIAWMAMWKSPAGKDGFTWGEPGKISIAAFCRNYGEYLARGQASLAKAAQGKAAQSDGNETGVSGLKRWRAPGTTQAALAQ